MFFFAATNAYGTKQMGLSAGAIAGICVAVAIVIGTSVALGVVLGSKSSGGGEPQPPPAITIDYVTSTVPTDLLEQVEFVIGFTGPVMIENAVIPVHNIGNATGTLTVPIVQPSSPESKSGSTATVTWIPDDAETAWVNPTEVQRLTLVVGGGIVAKSGDPDKYGDVDPTSTRTAMELALPVVRTSVTSAFGVPRYNTNGYPAACKYAVDGTLHMSGMDAGPNPTIVYNARRPMGASAFTVVESTITQAGGSSYRYTYQHCSPINGMDVTTITGEYNNNDNKFYMSTSISHDGGDTYAPRAKAAYDTSWFKNPFPDVVQPYQDGSCTMVTNACCYRGVPPASTTDPYVWHNHGSPFTNVATNIHGTCVVVDNTGVIVVYRDTSSSGNPIRFNTSADRGATWEYTITNTPTLATNSLLGMMRSYNGRVYVFYTNQSSNEIVFKSTANPISSNVVWTDEQSTGFVNTRYSVSIVGGHLAILYYLTTGQTWRMRIYKSIENDDYFPTDVTVANNLFGVAGESNTDPVTRTSTTAITSPTNDTDQAVWALDVSIAPL